MADNNFRGWVFKRESKNKNLSVCTKASTIEALSNIAAESEMNRNEIKAVDYLSAAFDLTEWRDGSVKK